MRSSRQYHGATADAPRSTEWDYRSRCYELAVKVRGTLVKSSRIYVMVSQAVELLQPVHAEPPLDGRLTSQEIANVLAARNMLDGLKCGPDGDMAQLYSSVHSLAIIIEEQQVLARPL